MAQPTRVWKATPGDLQPVAQSLLNKNVEMITDEEVSHNEVNHLTVASSDLSIQKAIGLACAIIAAMGGTRFDTVEAEPSRGSTTFGTEDVGEYNGNISPWTNSAGISYPAPTITERERLVANATVSFVELGTQKGWWNTQLECHQVGYGILEQDLVWHKQDLAITKVRTSLTKATGLVNILTQKLDDMSLNVAENMVSTEGWSLVDTSELETELTTALDNVQYMKQASEEFDGFTSEHEDTAVTDWTPAEEEGEAFMNTSNSNNLNDPRVENGQAHVSNDWGALTPLADAYHVQHPLRPWAHNTDQAAETDYFCDKFNNESALNDLSDIYGAHLTVNPFKLSWESHPRMPKGVQNHVYNPDLVTNQSTAAQGWPSPTQPVIYSYPGQKTVPTKTTKYQTKPHGGIRRLSDILEQKEGQASTIQNEINAPTLLNPFKPVPAEAADSTWEDRSTTNNAKPSPWATQPTFSAAPHIHPLMPPAPYLYPHYRGGHFGQRFPPMPNQHINDTAPHPSYRARPPQDRPPPIHVPFPSAPAPAAPTAGSQADHEPGWAPRHDPWGEPIPPTPPVTPPPPPTVAQIEESWPRCWSSCNDMTCSGCHYPPLRLTGAARVAWEAGLRGLKPGSPLPKEDGTWANAASVGDW